MIKSKYSAAITDKPWWLAGGIPSANCVAAYQPVGAASLAASYTNLANPGNYTAAAGAAPAWDAINGWDFAPNKYLTCGITPGYPDWSMIIRFSGIGSNSDYTLAGCYDDASNAFLLQPKTQTLRKYYNGGVLSLTGNATSGVMAIAGRSGYLNGTKETGSIATGKISSAIFIGALNYRNGTPIQYSKYIQAFAIYNATITDAEVAALTNAMNAL